MDSTGAGVWVFGDYADYFQNRVTLQLIAKAKSLAKVLETGVGVVVLGEGVSQYVMEYAAHGADMIFIADHPDLKDYDVELFTSVTASWVELFSPEIFLAGATPFGREFFPRLAKRLKTGLSADCVALEIDPETGLLVQTTPAFGGELLADIVTPEHRPQMATVHPGIFKELQHDPFATAVVVYPQVPSLPSRKIELIRRRRERSRKASLKEAKVVVVGGKGMGSAAGFEKLFHLAELLEGEVGATRPAVTAGWAGEERLLGQTGKNIKPRLVISIGTSGAIQYTAGIQGSEVVIAINRDHRAPIFGMADLGLVGDAQSIVNLLIEELNRRI
ncbi:MAG: electron transfer flavoprotein subunit alpha/FixB family protein [Desulfobacteraceae bacterium]|jgi:electron transfer flavoprotein alpha subunit|nr:MAG: electron transfer flavoprotein subunit alpha/FixB family protein [Desulfobacteraceae bacterium]